MNYLDDIKQIKGIGEKTAKLFYKLGVLTVGDLVSYYPRDYDLYERIIPIQNATIGKIATIEGFINNAPKSVKVRNLNILSVMLKDETASIQLNWFNMPFLMSKLKIGTRFILRGKVIEKKGILTMEQPEFIDKEDYFKTLNALKPIYKLTKGLSNKVIIKSINCALESLDFTTDYLDAKFRKEYDLLEYKKAIKLIHNPKDKEEMVKARKRIVFDEFFVFAMALRGLKENDSNAENGIKLKKDSVVEEFVGGLGYQLTGAQQRTWKEIENDMTSGACMNRLVQGDVGSGKTVVAQLALMLNAKNGYQGMMMAPTEVLARQHFETFSESLKKYNINVGLLVGSMTAKEKKAAYDKIKNHEWDIIIGTHALIQDKVEYDMVGLVVTDEQHRFGVRQRELLAKKGDEPHMLVMSATPIPRTLAIIMYGDLDISVIDELPKGRKHIKNCVVNTNYRHTAYEFIRKEIETGRQAYVICPMVEENEEIDAENVVGYTEKLRQVFPESIKVEYLHGAMKPKDKNEIMDRFASGEINVLVSTTVVEVGVNVPNSTIIMIENADRFGLAQLHQLRGRVGRGQYQSYCIMINSSNAENVSKRLDILNKSNDGFFIASEDLRMRGPGELFGTMQSGELIFRLADVYNDSSTLLLANNACKKMTVKQFYEIVNNNERLRMDIDKYMNRATL